MVQGAKRTPIPQIPHVVSLNVTHARFQLYQRDYQYVSLGHVFPRTAHSHVEARLLTVYGLE